MTRLLLITSFVLHGAVFAQSAEEVELEKLRQEVKTLEKNLHEQVVREKQTIDTVEKLDRKISLEKEIVGKLAANINRQKKRRTKLERQRVTLARRLDKVQDIFAQRMVSLYKNGRIGTLELLINAKNVNQMLLWAEYQRRLAQMDARLISSIKTRKAKLDSSDKEVALLLEKQHQSLREKKLNQKKLEQSRQAKKKLLQKIRRDKKVYVQQVADYLASIKRIQKIITESEAQREREEKARRENNDIDLQPADFTRDYDFKALKGKLPWPVVGKVIRKYGPYKHPVLKTVTENIGVDIKAGRGTPVRCVAGGKVTAITWQRGRGNLIIVNHSDGFYTVYTHVDQIIVKLQENIAAGTALGVVGEAGLDKDPLIHFQVWQKFDHLNPQEWLE